MPRTSGLCFLFDRAEQILVGAEILYKNGDFGGCVSRGYYFIDSSRRVVDITPERFAELVDFMTRAFDEN